MSDQEFDLMVEREMEKSRRRARTVVRRILVRRHGEDVAEEALQDACLMAWRHRRKFRGDCAFNTWFHRIAVNEALQRLRHDARFSREEPLLEQVMQAAEDELPELPFSDDRLNPEEQLLRKEAYGRVREALLRVGPTNRGTVALRFLMEMRADETARAQGVCVSTIKARTRRGLQEMRAAYGEAR